MSNLTEKAAYLKGLMQGLDIDQTTKEGKLFAAMVDLMDEMSDTIADLESNQNALNDLVDVINEDLDELTQEFYGYDDFDEDEEDDEDYDDDEAVYEVTCDGCGETFYLDEDEVAQGSYVCPACGKTLEFEFEDDCDCGCHHHDEDEDQDQEI